MVNTAFGQPSVALYSNYRECPISLKRQKQFVTDSEARKFRYCCSCSYCAPSGCRFTCRGDLPAAPGRAREPMLRVVGGVGATVDDKGLALTVASSLPHGLKRCGMQSRGITSPKSIFLQSRNDPAHRVAHQA
eukprot:6185244-Pleurochrysis_carterae.AAC.4